METNNNRLNDLFNQAKNQAPKASFETIKRQFEQSLLTAGGGATTSLFTLKNGLIMATISTIGVGAIMVIDAVTTPHPTTTPTVKIEKIQATDSVAVEQERVKVFVEYLEKVKRLDPVLKTETDIELQLALKTVEPIVLKVTSTTPEQQEIEASSTKMAIDTTFRFPRLTEEEKKANNKQKEKMIKQLIKQDKRTYAFIPSETITLKGEKVSIQAFYMQTKEVTNLEYRTFLFDLLLQDRKDEFLIAKPNQDTWMTEYEKAFMKPMQENYFAHPAYNDYPVVAISREGAELYCQWLIQEANKVNQAKRKPLLNDLRLPSDQEWMCAAMGGRENMKYPWGGLHLRNAKGEYLANFTPKKDSLSLDGGFFQVKVDSYHQNGYGLYCMSGNVAEMVYFDNDKNKPGTKGGSWTSLSHELQIEDENDRFKGRVKPSVNIGFRPVMTYLGK